MKKEIELGFEFAPVGLVLCKNRIIAHCNDTFCKIVGYQKPALLGQSFAMFYANNREFDRVRDVGLERLKRQESYTDERMMRCRDSSFIWCRFRANTLTPNQPLRKVILSFAPIPERGLNVLLTMREREVIALLADGMTSKLIARNLSLSPRTVEDVRARLLKKFKVKNTAALLGVLSDMEN